jgi:hypothetical protein
MNIKLQRCTWNDANKDNITNIGTALELPITFSITEVNTSKQMMKKRGLYTNALESLSYNAKSLLLTGTIFENASKSDTLTKKDEIISYISDLKKYAGQFQLLKIFQNKHDTKFWLGSVESVDLNYERQRSVINVSISISLEEPFQFGDRKEIAITTTPVTVTNLSTVSFLPDKIQSSALGTFTLEPIYSATMLQQIQFTAAGIIYPKTFRGNIDSLNNSSFVDLLRIPQGNFTYKRTAGSATVTLTYWERFI